MSRFFDQLRREAKLTEEWDIPVIEASNVAEYFFRHPQENWEYDDIPNLAPPFRQCFIECNAPRTIYSEALSHPVPWPQTHPVRWGIQVDGHTADEARNLFEQVQSKKPQLAQRVEDAGGFARAKWVLHCVLAAKTHQIESVAHKYILVDESGQAYYDLDYVNDHLIDRCVVRLQEDREEMQRTVARHLWIHYVPCLLAISFLHCKNVVRTLHEPDAPLQKKAIKKHGLPLTKWYTLNIDPMREVLRHEGGIENHGLKKALHICRGHFSTYTEDAPRFGRAHESNIGTFWIPQHVRGTAESGIIIKDYNVEAPQ